MSIEAEQSLVAAVLLSAERYETVSASLAASDFADTACRMTYEIAAGLRDAGREADAVSVGSALRMSVLWPNVCDTDPIAWCEAITGICSTTPRAIAAYIEIVRESATSRRLAHFSVQVKAISEDGDMPGVDKLGEAERLLNPLLSQAAGDEFHTPKDIGREALIDLLAKAESPGELTGIASGWRDFDAWTGGMQDADLIVYAGRPSMGKTAGALNIATHVAKTEPVLIFSLEMSRKALWNRMASSVGRVDMGDILNARIDHVQADMLQAATLQIDQLDMRIDDRGGLSVDQLVARSRVAARKRKPRLIVVDYLTKLTGKGETRTAQVGYCAQRLKDLAKELNCPVLCLAQLNRGVDSRGDARPKMSDLRDSGEIEQEADIVMFNYLDEKYDDESARRGILELLIEKHRNGPTGTVWLDWQGQYQTFADRNQSVPPLKKPEPSQGGARLRAFSGGKDRAAGDPSEAAF